MIYTLVTVYIVLYFSGKIFSEIACPCMLVGI